MSPQSGSSQELIAPLGVGEGLAAGRESPLAAELRAAGRFAGDGFAGAVGQIEQTHRAIAGRVFGAVGPAGAPVKAMHDAVAGAVYRSTQAIGRAGLRLGGAAAGRAVPRGLPGADRRTATRVWKGAVNGLYGDRLESTGSELAVTMTPLVRGLPRARVAVFLHGLCETEDAWFLHAERCPAYGSRLRDELGFTPIYIRYNSGLPVDANGRLLAVQLEQLLALWPMQVREVVLIGHSMGGLVARAACDCARGGDGSGGRLAGGSSAGGGDGMQWARLVRHVVSLGTPHQGAPLEQAVSVAARVLSWVPETRGLAGALDARSAGVKDLGERMTVPYRPGIAYHYYSAGLGGGIGRGAADWGSFGDGRGGGERASDGGELTELVLGDLLVRRPSAWDTSGGDSIRFGLGDYRHLRGASHFDLLGHPAVSDQLVRWLGSTEP